jgi:GDP-L-fucose synthase
MIKIGVLGGTGFVGKNIAEQYPQDKWQYIIGSRKTGVDARSVASVCNWIQGNGITRIINLAAECGGIGLNKKKPADLWAATTQISFAALEASRISNIEKFVAVGTICSYAAECPTPFKEEYLMHYGPPEATNSGYGLAKLSALWGAKMYHQQYGLNVACLLPVNQYGPHDHFDLENSHVIPALIRKFQDAIKDRAKSVTLWGDGSPTREFLYAGDCAEALWRAVQSDTPLPEPVNVGSGNEISIKNLATKIAKIMHYEGDIIWDASKPNGQMRRCLDVSKAKNVLGFTAKTTLDVGLVRTIDWYRTEYRGE